MNHMNMPLKMTPMLQQYLEIKEAYPDTILFYRMGDFYEMFFEDAETAAKVLSITLTSRSSKEDQNRIPMCGIPFHAVSAYLGKMIRAGYRVAICEQVEDPKQSKGIVRREVIRVVSPGVTTDEQLLDEKTDCYVCAMAFENKNAQDILAGLAFIDVSTGLFQVTELSFPAQDPAMLFDTFTRLQPAELLLSQSDMDQHEPLISRLKDQTGRLCLTSRSDFHFQPDAARTALLEHFRTTSLAGFGCESYTKALDAAGALLLYLKETQKSGLSHIKRISPLHTAEFLIIDDASRRNLELTETLIGGQRRGSLLSVLDLTATPMGARLLRRWLLFPLRDRKQILARLDSTEDLAARNETRGHIRALLGQIHDIERLCSRLVLGQGNARDMNALKASLSRLPELRSLLSGCESPLLRTLGEQLDPLSDLHDLIDTAIREDAPVTLREGQLIREGFHAELDHFIHLLRDGKGMILALENTERERSGIPKLKVGYNKVFGYYFEVSRSRADALPDYFIRKQTLANTERFITPELKELEDAITTAQEKRLDLEYTLFLNIREQIAAQNQRILQTAERTAQADVLACFAETAVRYRYCRPSINEAGSITISEGRHPVIERNMEAGKFVPNDVRLDPQDEGLIIITGPNMAGKSTVLRQTALIVLLAHLGSFVPAESADICLTDRIFTRVGAMDDLRRGQSTFMVEMNETANILNNATENSLVILDEIGRGTSTYDGLAIAWAVAEELAGKNGIGIKTLFATHYHELTDLAATANNIRNYSIAVREWNDSIIFLHKLVRGATNRSYGIQVASLAGVPDHVIRRAGEILKNIEQNAGSGDGRAGKGGGKPPSGRKPPTQLSLFAAPTSPLAELIASLKPDEISPKQALEILYQAIRLLKEQDGAA